MNVEPFTKLSTFIFQYNKQHTIIIRMWLQEPITIVGRIQMLRILLFIRKVIKSVALIFLDSLKYLQILVDLEIAINQQFTILLNKSAKLLSVNFYIHSLLWTQKSTKLLPHKRNGLSLHLNLSLTLLKVINYNLSCYCCQARQKIPHRFIKYCLHKKINFMALNGECRNQRHLQNLALNGNWIEDY